MFFLKVLLVLALIFSATLLPTSSPQTASAADCTFVLGFQTIHDQTPDTVGNCLVDQHYNPDNGDAIQETTGGMLVWRKADNFTAFTNGYRSWVNGPYGLQQRLNTERFDWEASPPEAAPIAAPSPVAAPPAALPTLTPTPPAATLAPAPRSYNYYVLPRVGSPLVLGGTQIISARLTVPDDYNAPPAVGAMATFRYGGISFDVPTGPDGWATAIVNAPPGGGCFVVTISYIGRIYGVPGWEDANRCWK